MPDLGQRLTDERLEKIKNQLQRIYTEAAKDLQKKAEQYTNKFKVRDLQMRAKLTDAEYKRWQQGQVFIGKQWQSKVQQMARSLIGVEQNAVEIVTTGQYDCFADNANYMEFSIDRDFSFGMNFSIYDTNSVSRLIEEEPELLRRRYVDGKACEAWNVKVINNCITQGIIQGESIPDIAKRMARDTASTDMKAMVRYARTAMTGAQNSGRIRGMQESMKLGIYVRKVWVAVADERTRAAHLDLDGQTAEVNEAFDSDLGPIMYPGDPEATDENVWNCRCALGYEYPDRADIESMYGEEYEDEYDEFEEWLEEHDVA